MSKRKKHYKVLLSEYEDQLKDTKRTEFSARWRKPVLTDPYIDVAMVIEEELDKTPITVNVEPADMKDALNAKNLEYYLNAKMQEPEFRAKVKAEMDRMTDEMFANYIKVAIKG